MRLARLEQMRRSPKTKSSSKKRPPLMGSIQPDASPPKNVGGTQRRGSKRKLEMYENQKRMQASSGGTPLMPNRSSVDEGNRKMKSGTDTPSNNNNAVTTDDSDWKYIDRTETIAFQFQENENPSSISPYSLEVIWIHEDHEYFIAKDASAFGGCECSEKFVPLIEGAARRASSLTSFVVRYNNKLDRTWPYTKVSRIAEVVSGVLGKEAVLESVDSDYFDYIVTLVAEPSQTKRKCGSSGSSFVGKVDFSHMDIMRKYYVFDYMGEDAIDLM